MLQNNQNKNLVLIEDLGTMFATETSNRKRRYGLYRCYCGVEFKVMISSIKSGNTKSCGCRERTGNTIHGFAKHRLYSVWCDMMYRWHNEKHKAYKDYGERGIKVCDEWHNVENFIDDMNVSFAIGLTIDRINNDKGYSKDNCRWTTRNVQMRNTRKLINTNSSNYRGVSFFKRDNKFRTRIVVNSKEIHLGLFETVIEAARVYDSYVIDNNLEHTRNFN